MPQFTQVYTSATLELFPLSFLRLGITMLPLLKLRTDDIAPVDMP